jgi:lipopolysaccharide biosynthesis protein
MLVDLGSDMPFCLCWANENWTRRWDAAEHEILIAQRYLPDDDLNFIKSLIPFFSDPRYIRIDGKPFLVVYRPQHLPDARKTASIWRDYCRSVGIGEIHLCAALTHGNEDYTHFGFDSGVEFPPHNLKCQNVASQIAFYQPFRGTVARYRDIAQSYLDREYQNNNVFKSVFPSWDNSPRTGSRGVIVLDGTPANYEYWLAETMKTTMKNYPDQERFVFINAWNEWAEGCYLEPDRKYQSQFLESTLRASSGLSRQTRFSDEVLPSLTGKKRTLLYDLHWVFACHFFALVGQVATSLKKYPRLRKFVRWVFNVWR